MSTFVVHGFLLFALFGAGCGESVPAPPLSSEGASRETELRIALYRGRVARDSLDFIARNRLAENYLQRARETGNLLDYERAEMLLQQSQQILRQGNFAAVDGLIRVRLAQHRFDEALRMTQRERQRRPQEMQLLAYMGDAYFELGDLEEAERAYRAFATSNPGLAAWSRLAQIETKRGCTSRALALFERARDSYHGARNKPLAWTWIRTGGLHLQEGATRLARQHFIEALRLWPNSYLALEHLAETFEVEGRDRDARPYLQAAIGIRRAPELLQRLAALEERAGRHRVAQTLELEAQELSQSIPHLP